MDLRPYHDLTLADPVADPEWIDRFENHMKDCKFAKQSKNNYRSAMSRMYTVAMLPRYRKITGITMNPFKHTG